MIITIDNDTDNDTDNDRTYNSYREIIRSYTDL